MKNYYIYLLALVLSPTLHAQNYIPMLLDSSYYRFEYNVQSDTFLNISISAYTYDFRDSLIQQRLPTFRHNFSYAPDTVFKLTERLGANNIWQTYSRATTASSNGKVLSVFQEIFANGNWENSALRTYGYDAYQHDTLELSRVWNDSVWRNYYKKTRTYNAAGDMTMENIYYANSSGEFTFNQGSLFEYDPYHNLIQKISINNSVTGPYYTSKWEWAYGDDYMLDTSTLCHYYGDVCTNAIMNTYSYSGEDTILSKHFQWINDVWAPPVITLQHTYDGPGVYGSEPDSILSYRYTNQTFIPYTRQYFHYQELGNDTIYYQERLSVFNINAGAWILYQSRDEWYHLKTTNETHEIRQTPPPVTVFPNPSKAGQTMTLQRTTDDQTPLEIVIFDQQGKMVSISRPTTEGTIQAPLSPGVFSIVVRQGGRLTGVIKQVVVE